MGITVAEPGFESENESSTKLCAEGGCRFGPHTPRAVHSCRGDSPSGTAEYVRELGDTGASLVKVLGSVSTTRVEERANEQPAVLRLADDGERVHR